MSQKHDFHQLGEIAADIMFGARYQELIYRVYSSESEIARFETDPGTYLREKGIEVPAQIEVVLHDPGTVGHPGRVDFHYEHPDNLQGATLQDVVRVRRDRARAAWHFLHSQEMRALKARIKGSPIEVKVFAEAPRAYAAANGIAVPSDLEIVVHPKESGEPRIDVHFSLATNLPISPGARPNGGLGCCYCDPGGPCCIYGKMN